MGIGVIEVRSRGRGLNVVEPVTICSWTLREEAAKMEAVRNGI